MSRGGGTCIQHEENTTGVWRHLSDGGLFISLGTFICSAHEALGLGNYLGLSANSGWD